jgi:predicted nuclease of restriction endonuclease-like (RecB) superfamily
LLPIISLLSKTSSYTMKNIPSIYPADFEHIIQLIEESRNRAYANVNAELVLLYFNVGYIVSEKVMNGIWGEGTVAELGKFIQQKQPTLTMFNRRGLYRMKQFYETYNTNSDCFKLWYDLHAEKVSPMATLLEDAENQHKSFLTSVLLQTTWSNHLEILSGAKPVEQKIFYLVFSIKERWNKMELRRQLKSAFFERTMLANQIVSPKATLLPKDFFKEPYIFEFLELPVNYSEKDLEKALIRNLQKFILEIGKGFTYMGNQFRLQVGNKDYYTDLLFFHRDLQCLVLFELKIEEFQPEFLGKVNFYLEALDRDVKRSHENPSIGILLCTSKDVEVVEFAMARNNSPTLIAEYETKLIDKKTLADKLHQLVEIFNQKKR